MLVPDGVSPRHLNPLALSLSKGAAHGELVEPRAEHYSAVVRNEVLAYESMPPPAVSGSLNCSMAVAGSQLVCPLSWGGLQAL